MESQFFDEESQAFTGESLDTVGQDVLTEIQSTTATVGQDSQPKIFDSQPTTSSIGADIRPRPRTLLEKTPNKRRPRLVPIPSAPMKRARGTTAPKPVQRSLAYDPAATQVDITDLIKKEEENVQDSGVDTLSDNDENKENKRFFDARTSDKFDNFTKEERLEFYRKHPTMSQDAEHYKYITVVDPNHARQVAVTLDPRTAGEFTQFKVFKKFPETNFCQRAQQVSLRTIEAERVILQLRHFLNSVNIYDFTRKEFKFQSGIDEKADLENAHWSRDITRTPNRLVRVTFVCYDVAQPDITTYFQVKLYKKDEGGVYKLNQWVSITLQEMADLAVTSTQICRNLK